MSNRSRVLDAFLRKLNYISKNLARESSTNVRRALMILERIADVLESLANILNDYRNLLKLSEIRLITKRVCRIIEENVSVIDSLLKGNIFLKLRLAKVLYQTGCIEFSLKLFSSSLESIIKESSDFEKVAEFIDASFECGLLDFAIKALERLVNMGLSSLDISYNLALAYYLAGQSLKSLEMIKKTIRKYGEKRQLSGLLSAVYIAMGEFEKASEILEKLR